MPKEYDVGDVAEIAITIRDRGGALADAGTLTVTVQSPQTKTVSNPPTTRDSIGKYHFDLPFDEYGEWKIKVKNEGGTAPGAGRREIRVLKPSF